MKTLSSTEIQNNFEMVINLVKQGELITVTHDSKPTMMILPYELAKEALQLYNTQKLKIKSTVLNTSIKNPRY
jgi:prevent-host-death family protein